MTQPSSRPTPPPASPRPEPPQPGSPQAGDPHGQQEPQLGDSQAGDPRGQQGPQRDKQREPQRDSRPKPQPGSPQGGAPHGPRGQRGKDAKGGSKRPETVVYMLWLWLGVVVGETVHQILNVVLTLLNHDVLMAQAKQMVESASGGEDGEEVSDSLIEMAAYGSVALSAAIAIGVLVLLLFLLKSLAEPSKRAGTSRRIWFAFSIYFGFRILLTFMVTPAGADVPDWLFAADGMVQILVGVAAVLGLIFSIKPDTLDYTGELEQMRELEKELEQARRDKEREKREKQEAKEKDAKEKDAKQKDSKDKVGRNQSPRNSASQNRGDDDRVNR
ncbi:proline-rich domain-containing protein [Corynebacterium segmentosum]